MKHLLFFALILSAFALRAQEDVLTEENFWTQLPIKINSAFGVDKQKLAYSSSTKTLFITTATGVISKSYDDGLTWQPTSLNDCLSVFVNNNGVVFAVKKTTNPYAQMIMYSTDNANTWAMLTDTLPLSAIHCMYAYDSTIIVCMEHIHTSLFRVMRSPDMGVTWDTVLNFNEEWPGDVAPIIRYNDSTLFFGIGCGQIKHVAGIYRSTDNGQSWSRVTELCSTSICKNSSGTLFSSTGGTILKSEDGGSTWNSIPTPDVTWYLAIDKNDYIYAARGNALCPDTTTGVYISKDNGNTWELNMSGLTMFGFASNIYSFDNDYVYLTINSVFRSTDKTYPVITSGDANQDGEANMADIAAMVAFILDMPPETFNFPNADINSDGAITLNDIILLVGLISKGR